MRECCRQVEAEVVSSSSSNILHQIGTKPFSRALYSMIQEILFIAKFLVLDVKSMHMLFVKVNSLNPKLNQGNYTLAKPLNLMLIS